jgi:hypothetical protein
MTYCEHLPTCKGAIQRVYGNHFGPEDEQHYSTFGSSKMLYRARAFEKACVKAAGSWKR